MMTCLSRSNRLHIVGNESFEISYSNRTSEVSVAEFLIDSSNSRNLCKECIVVMNFVCTSADIKHDVDESFIVSNPSRTDFENCNLERSSALQ